MKKYQLKLRNEPQKVEMFNNHYRLFYNTKYVTINEDSYWLCDVVEYDEIPMIDFDKWRIRECIKAYDSSYHVNEFIVNNVPMWLDKDTRVGLMLRFEAEAAFGKLDTTLWYNGHPLTLSISKAVEILKALESYASKCYNVTQLHLYNVSNLERDDYDYRSGYPDKLIFKL